MTFHETTSSSSGHPYRSAVEPCPLDCDGLRVPYAGQSRMRLSLSSGLALGLVVIDPDAKDLIAIHCADGPTPRLRVAAGEIALTWRVSFGDWLRDALLGYERDVVIVLHPAVEWTLEIHSGLAQVELDLAAGKIARIDVHGGCSEVRFELPVPTRAVPIHIASGVSRVVMRRPAEVGVALATSGGMAALRLDEQRFGAIGGSAQLESRNLVPGAPRFELQVDGGAADLTVAVNVSDSE
jgi:hypothetical protein